MLSIIVNDCDDCGGITDMANKLEKVIAKLSKDQYNHYAYLAPSENKNKLVKLLFYKSMMDNLYWNSTYYCYNHQDIISRIKHLINV